jgi:hypothetical protein
MSFSDNPTRYDPNLIYAVVTYDAGYVLQWDDLQEWIDTPDESEYEPNWAYLVTGSAIPRSQSLDVEDIHRMPGQWRGVDMIVDTDLYSYDESEVAEMVKTLRRIESAIATSADAVTPETTE